MLRHDESTIKGPMKILLVNDAATPGGGAEILTLALRDEYRQRGHDARVFASTAAYGSQPREAEYTCFGTTSTYRTANRVINPSAWFSLRKALRDFQPDVVHVRMFTTQLSALILPMLRHIPSVYHATWREVICPIGLKLLPDGSICNQRAGTCCLKNQCVSAAAWGPLILQQQMCQRWLSAFDRIVANSDSVRESLIAEIEQPVIVIPNGVPVTPQRPALTSPPTVSYCGRLSREKGVEVLLRSFHAVLKRRPEAQLILVGEGELRSELESTTKNLDMASQVTFTGHLCRDEIEKQLAQAWVHTVPSVCAEGFGLVAAEAMMRGTAVIGSRAGGLLQVISAPKTGRLVPPGDEDALTQALLQFLEDRSVAECTGQAARKRALQEFSQAACAESFLNLYQSVIDERKTAK